MGTHRGGRLMSLQVPDRILFRGRHRQLLSYPLDAYLRDLPEQPEFRLRGQGQRRGYIASWEIRDDYTLWLTGLETRPPDDGPDPGPRLIFPSDGPVRAIWVSQPLWTPDLE